jgi:hypothetical protein
LAQNAHMPVRVPLEVDEAAQHGESFRFKKDIA